MTARKHHTVPQSILRRFARPENPKGVWVYDKGEDRAFPSTIRDAGAERDFYAMGSGEARIIWEPAFQAIDGRLAAVLQEVMSAETLADVPSEVQADIPLIVAIQLLRTQLQRSSVTTFVDQLNRVQEALGADALSITDDEVRLIHLGRLLGVRGLADALSRKDVLILRSADPDSSLWISDNPVVLHNSFTYGGVGLSAPGIEIYFPISPTRCLALYCPSIGDQIAESMDPKHPRPRLTDPLFALMLKGVQFGTLVPIGGDVVTFLNELQVRSSSRFLYSAQPNFTLAESLLSSHPALRHIESLFKLGELGAGPPRFTGMPPGTFLLVERGHQHHVIAVVDHTPGSEGGCMKVQVLSPLKLASIGPNGTFASATLIVDGQSTHMMRDVVLEPHDEDGDQLILVRYADKGLRTLFEDVERPEA